MADVLKGRKAFASASLGGLCRCCPQGSSSGDGVEREGYSGRGGFAPCTWPGHRVRLARETQHPLIANALSSPLPFPSAHGFTNVSFQ